MSWTGWWIAYATAGRGRGPREAGIGKSAFAQSECGQASRKRRVSTADDRRS